MLARVLQRSGDAHMFIFDLHAARGRQVRVHVSDVCEHGYSSPPLSNASVDLQASISRQLLGVERPG